MPIDNNFVEKFHASDAVILIYAISVLVHSKGSLVRQVI